VLFADGTYLKNCNVYVGYNPTNVISQTTCGTIGNPFGIPLGGHQTFNCSQQLYGRYITIRKTVANEPITICEVTATGHRGIDELK
jgi:hypothetical protein